MAKQSIIIIDDEKSICDSLSLVLAEKYEVDTAADGEEALSKITGQAYDLALLDIRLPGIDGLEVLRRLRKIAPQTAVVMITATKAISTAVEALKIGASDYLTKPMNIDDLLATIAKVLREKEEKVSAPAGAQKQVASIFGSKGGCGKTTLACNLAVALEKGGLTTCLLDLNIQFGSCAVMLDVVPEKNICDYLAAGEEAVITDFLTIHQSGLRLFPSSTRWEEMASLKAEEVKKIIAALRRKFACVIIDNEKFLQAVTLEALASSDLVLYLLSPDIPAVRNASLGLDFLESSYLDPKKISLVLNNLSSVKELSDKEISDYLGRPLAAAIPCDPASVMAAANKGVPFVISSPDCPASRAVAEIAGLIRKGQLAVK